MVADYDDRGGLEQETHRDGHLSNEFSPLLFHEGFNIDHDGNMIVTSHVDFRLPGERTSIGALIKYSQEKFAIERSLTVKLSKPGWFRQDGETLIYDGREGFATRETVVQREVPFSDDEQARTQSLNDDINRAIELSGEGAVRVNTGPKRRTITNRKWNSLEWGNDFWVFCVAMEPTSDVEREALLASLDPEYDHETYIPSPRTFAQTLARAYVEAYGAPLDGEEPMKHTIDGVFVGSTYHRHLIVIHGPVVYVDDPYATCTSAMDSQIPLVRTMLPIFVKGKDYSAQREYRFVIADKTLNQTDSKIMPATPMLVAAIGRRRDSEGPMIVPDFDTTGVEILRPSETTRLPRYPNLPMPPVTFADAAELTSESPAILDSFRAVSEEEPTKDFHETVGVYPAVATLHEKIDGAFMGVAAAQPERKPYLTSAAWYAERSIRRLCHRFEDPIAGIRVTDDNSVVIDIRLSHWNASECKLAVRPSGVFALTLKRKSGRMPTTHFSLPISGDRGMATALDGRHLDTIADFEPLSGQGQ